VTALNVVLLLCAAGVAGALNSVAGGGSFISFPTLMFTGVPAIPANATNTVALWPGMFASARAYRKELAGQKRMLILLGVSSVVGGILGAILLLRTPQPTFVRLIPFLLLGATLLFVFGGRITARLKVHTESHMLDQWYGLASAFLIQLVISVYGGYFGGGIGILMLASFALMGMENIHSMNALKAVLGGSINVVAAVTFAIKGAVYWPQASVMMVGAIAGGYAGAFYARRIAPATVRKCVTLLAFGMTVYFFIKTYGIR